ncbi:hypothetical protein [Hyphomonas chukchiensis]|uniref:Uncharacterized protein n=1 Tax=Hyphomonas chukchiensis TaxID=1280947 RepID=A0A062UJX2_9PROT|nr:hypothetical protein [Hyphomonas chukchiensis]KCZ59579.1 hypothetical protein HY30_14180 [Hyphomonas chukchiensis]
MFTKDFTKPEPVRPMIPESVRQTVRAAQDAGRRAEERANMNMPFRARLRARDAVRPQSTLAIISGIQAKAADTARPVKPLHSRGPVRPLRAVSTNPGLLPHGRNGKGGGQDDDDTGSRLADISQLAFAGLAVLGLAGLSVMAADSALHNGDPESGSEADPLRMADVDPVVAPSAASSIAMAEASTPVGTAPTPWFNYQGVADQLAARKAAFETAQREAATAEAEKARIEAANAIADAEAQRLAEAAQQDAATERARAAAAELEKTRLAEAEAARVAEADAQRQAALEAEQAAAAEVEAKRLAEIEARRVAQAEAEAQRVADLKAKQAADAEAKRLADAAAEQKRLAAVASENQKKRLAAAEAEERRLAALNASAAIPASVAVKPSATPKASVQMVAYSGPIPAAATLKPDMRPTLVAAAPLTVTERSVNTPAYTQSAPKVRPFAAAEALPSPRNVDEFVAERVSLTAAEALDPTLLNTLRHDFLRMVETEADGATRILATPDGRKLEIRIERSTTREASKPTVRPLNYTGQATDSVVRYVADVMPMKVSVTCRDLAYSFPGQERGRFAACEAPTGGWVLGRASDAGA